MDVRDQVRWLVDVSTVAYGHPIHWPAGTRARVVAADDQTVTVRTASEDGRFADLVLAREAPDGGLSVDAAIYLEGEEAPLVNDRRAGPDGQVAAWSSKVIGVYDEVEPKG